MQACLLSLGPRNCDACYSSTGREAEGGAGHPAATGALSTVPLRHEGWEDLS